MEPTIQPTLMQPVQLLRPIILKQEDPIYGSNIDAVNKIDDSPMDCQYCWSQRAVGAAPYASTTV